MPHHTPPPKSLALVVLLENVGHIHGLNLPPWATRVVDFVTEEYAKLALRLHGATRRYDQVIVLEDAQATSDRLFETLRQTSRSHRVDQLHLVHGQPGALVGYQGKHLIGPDFFAALLALKDEDPRQLDLRMVYGLNCYGLSLAPTWLKLGAVAVNGANGVNWLPEPSLSLFLHHWLRGATFAQSVSRSHSLAMQMGQRIWSPTPDGQESPFLAGSHQAIYGRRDLSITST